MTCKDGHSQQPRTSYNGIHFKPLKKGKQQSKHKEKKRSVDEIKNEEIK